MIKTLAMLKMEKNFIAHNEKKYPRQPYKKYDLHFWLKRISQEWYELELAIKHKDYDGIREELADLSNLIDYAYERTLIEEDKEENNFNFPQYQELSQLFAHEERLKK